MKNQYSFAVSVVAFFAVLLSDLNANSQTVSEKVCYVTTTERCAYCKKTVKKTLPDLDNIKDPDVRSYVLTNTLLGGMILSNTTNRAEEDLCDISRTGRHRWETIGTIKEYRIVKTEKYKPEKKKEPIYDDADSYIRDGDLNFSNSNYQGAITNYTKAINLDTKNIKAYTHRGHAKVTLKEYENAIGDYNAVLKIDSNNLGAYLNRGCVRFFLKDNKSASNDFYRVIQTIGKNDLPLSGTADYLYALSNQYLQNYELAMKYYKAFIILPLDNQKYDLIYNLELSSVYYNIACCYSVLSDDVNTKVKNDDIDHAFYYLEQCFKNGYKDFSWLKQDTELDNIRSLPYFSELVKQYYPQY